MKYIALIWVGLGFLSTSAFALTDPEQRLLSAQIQYQNALKNHDQGGSRLKKAQQDAEAAKVKLTDAQNILKKAEDELAQATAAKTQAEQALAEASRNLDAAWGK